MDRTKNPSAYSIDGLAFMRSADQSNYVTAAGFFEVQCYFRPPGLPCHKQPWLSTVWRKG